MNNLGYVSVDKLIEFANNHIAGIDTNDIARFPTADVEEIRHGKWIKDESEIRVDGEIYDYCCSLCKSSAIEGSYGNHDVFTPYCPYCGAKMDKENEDDIRRSTKSNI